MGFQPPFDPRCSKSYRIGTTTGAFGLGPRSFDPIWSFTGTAFVNRRRLPLLRAERQVARIAAPSRLMIRTRFRRARRDDKYPRLQLQRRYPFSGSGTSHVTSSGVTDEVRLAKGGEFAGREKVPAPRVQQ